MTPDKRNALYSLHISLTLRETYKVHTSDNFWWLLAILNTNSREINSLNAAVKEKRRRKNRENGAPFLWSENTACVCSIKCFAAGRRPMLSSTFQIYARGK